MTSFRNAFCFAAIFVCAGQVVASEPINWRVVLSSSSSTVLLPQLPTGGYSMFPLPGEVSDSSAATPGFNLTRDDGRKGLWREFAGNLQPYAETGITGAVGPWWREPARIPVTRCV